MQVTIKPKVLIGMAGKMGSGKSSVSDCFVKNNNFVKLSFAKPLKDSLVLLTGLDISNFTDMEKKEVPIPGVGKSPRELMQLMATDFIREMVNYDFWLWRMGQSISKFSDRDIIIDDVRFENEANFIRSNGGKIVHIKRDFEFASNHKQHKSEKGVKIQLNDTVLHAEDTVESTATVLSMMVLK